MEIKPFKEILSDVFDTSWMNEEELDLICGTAEAYSHAKNKELINALEKIEQMSDPGSYEKAIIDMKQIATKALKNQ